jgi:hypothetical protein
MPARIGNAISINGLPFQIQEKQRRKERREGLKAREPKGPAVRTRKL